MKQYTKYIFGSIIIVWIMNSMINCVPKRKIAINGVSSIGIENDKVAFYKNDKSGDTSQAVSLWNVLNTSRKYKNKKFSSNAKVELWIINNKLLNANLWDNDVVVESIALKGKKYNEYFSVRRKVSPIGIPLIYFWYYERKLLIGKSRNEKLLIKRSLSRFGIIFIISGGNNEIFCFDYEKI